MIWLLTIPVFGYFAFNSMIHDKLMAPTDFMEWCFTIFFACFFTGIFSLIPIGIACYLGSLPERHGIEDQTYNLVTLREKDGVQGTFYFLGAGQINDVQYYFWYRRAPDGSIRGGRTHRASGVRIYEIDDGTAPRMITFKTQYRSPNIVSILWLFAIDPRSDEDWYPDFYIPKGSIKEGYAL